MKKFSLISKAIAFTVFATFAAQSPVMALGTQQKSFESSSDSRSYQGAIAKPILIAQDGYYRSQSRDFRILMPGDISSNKVGGLSSTSLKTGTAYLVITSDIEGVDFLNSKQKFQQLEQVVRSSTKELGYKILKLTKTSLQGYPGLEVFALSSESATVVSKQYFVRNRVYTLFASSTAEMGQEVEDFFNSFEVYPSKIISR